MISMTMTLDRKVQDFISTPRQMYVGKTVQSLGAVATEAVAVTV